MNEIRKKRLALVGLLVLGVGSATALALTGLRGEINHFYSPSELIEGKVQVNQRLRLGGVLKEGSVQRATDSLKVQFVVTDRFKDTTVRFEGILPDLFKEGQSVITTGRLQADGTIAASEILAKHDENYMPPEAAEAMARAQLRRQNATNPEGALNP